MSDDDVRNNETGMSSAAGERWMTFFSQAHSLVYYVGLVMKSPTSDDH